MGDLAANLEVTKLRRQLGASDSSLVFLEGLPATELRAVRATISAAMFARHEAKFVRIAGLTKLLPTALTAKIAAKSIGPVLSAQIANVLDAKDAVKLARAMKPEFLVEVSIHLDPSKVEPIIAGLPSELIIDVGKRLLAKDEHVTLGRFVSVVEVEESLGVIKDASAWDLFLVALYTEQVPPLDAILSLLPTERLREVISVALKNDRTEDALTVMGALSASGRARLVVQAAELSIDDRDALIVAVDRNHLWGDIVSVIDQLPQSALSALVNVPATNDVDVMTNVTTVVRELDLATVMGRVLTALDDEHLQVLRTVPLLHEAPMQKWLTANSGESAEQARVLIADLKSSKR